ncbi:MAG: hypothetical protein PWR01_4139, partial [Clostridiales bacterium]|nr:hypothetical protein [Clostridiales bacterium]MDN5283066.1 hypothetical protein [Candidatus Ozemobacter sp.]
MRTANRRNGQALVVILMICLVLGILGGAVLTFQRGQINLLSKSARDYIALCVAETGLHCVLAEMKADYQFVTHGNPYIPTENWGSPSSHKYTMLKSFKLLKLDNNDRGTYSGSVEIPSMNLKGEFKVRMKLIGAKNSVDTETVDESHRYFRLEAIGRVEGACRKISTVIEKILPGNFVFYDGQVLDTGGYGPYRVISGEVRSGRLYGHELILFSRRGTFDRGAELIETEKISTPGHIKAESPVQVEFKNGPRGTIKRGNDSSDPESFAEFVRKSGDTVIDYYFQDGYHGAKPQKLPPLNPDYWKNAQRPRPVFLRPGCGYRGFAESKWRNPAKATEVVYDLFFGWEYKNHDDKVLLYSEVPLRIWGCPPYKSLTIFCEKDVYIAGDFNANPENPQNYTLGFKDYSKEPRNGTDKNGVAVLSMGRIWFDYSNPLNFLRNELRTLIDYEIGWALGGDELNPLILGSTIFPPKLSTTSLDKRLPMTALNFHVVNAMASLPKTPPEIIPATLAGITAHPALKKLRDYLNYSNNPEEYKTRFCIKSDMKRLAIIEGLAGRAYMTGFILPGARDKAIDSIFEQAQKEMDKEEPDAALGPWNAADRLFKLAMKYPKTGFKVPEMTVNALLVDSGEMNSRWSTGNGTTKVNNELGNIQSPEMRSFPFIGKNSRFIIRHMGSTVHLRTRQAKPFLSGSLRDDQSVVRRNVYDKTYVRGGG